MTETLLAVYPNEMLARLWADILSQDGIASVVKPQLGGYGPFGHDSFIHHGLYVMADNIERARAVIQDTAEEDTP